MPLSPDLQLQPHQARVRREAEEAARQGRPYRTLLNWGTGSGKTIGALGIADALGTPAAVVGPAALRPTIRAESQRFLGHQNYPVFSYQAAARGKVPPAETLIVDEAQRLNSPDSAQAKAVADLAAKARNVILMSATPVRNRPQEFAPLLSILTNKPISHEEFAAKYVGTEAPRRGLLGRLLGRTAPPPRPSVVNADELARALGGHVDVHEPSSPPVPVKEETVDAELPGRQADLYRGLFGRLPWVLRQKIKWQYPLTDQEMARARSFLTGPRQAALSDQPYRADKDALKAFESSGKLTKAFAAMKEKLEDERAKGIVYSNFVDAGLRPYSAKLTAEGIPHGIFHGGLSDVERKDLVDRYNRGELRAALVAPSGAEGISLKGTQLVQLLDKYWNQARTDQAKARGIRFDSHTHLPEDLRNVTVQHYKAKLPLRLRDRLLSRLGFDRSRERETTDDYLERMSTRKDDLNEQLAEVLRRAGTKSSADSRVEEVADKWFRPDGSAKTRATTQTMIRETMREYGLGLWSASALLRKAMRARSDDSVVGGDREYWSLVARMQKDESRGRKKESAKDRPVPDDWNAPADREDCPHCGAMHERGDGYCNSCGERWPAVTKTKKAEGSTAVVTPDDLPKVAELLKAAGWGAPPPAIIAYDGKTAEVSGEDAEKLAALVRYPGLGKMTSVPLFPANPVGLSQAVNLDARRRRALESLLAARSAGDAGAYGDKTNIVRDLISREPGDWLVDSHQDYTVGLTYKPLNFKVHMPRHLVADLLPDAAAPHAAVS